MVSGRSGRLSVSQSVSQSVSRDSVDSAVSETQAKQGAREFTCNEQFYRCLQCRNREGFTSLPFCLSSL